MCIFLTRTDTIELTRGIWFVYACASLISVKPQTYCHSWQQFFLVCLFFTLTVGKKKKKKKKHDPPQHDSEQNLLSCYWVWCVLFNYHLHLLWENMILLYRSLFLTSSNSLQTAAGRDFLSLFYSIVPIIAMERKHRPATLSQWQTSNLIKTNLTLTHTDPYMYTHTYISAAISALKVWVFCPKPGSLLAFSRGTLI